MAPLGRSILASVSLNGRTQRPAVIPTGITVDRLPYVIQIRFKTPATLHEIYILNPTTSKVSSIEITTEWTGTVSSTNPNAPKITFEKDIEYVYDLTVTIVSTTDNKIPSVPVQLSILGCIEKPSISTKGVIEPTTCQDEIALIPDVISGSNSSLIPRYFVDPQTPYKPSDINPSENGLSFPSSTKSYIIIFPIVPAAIIKSIRLPQSSNVNQIRVMFLDAQDQPIPSSQPLQITSNVETSPKVNVNFNTRVNAIHITLLQTNDGQPPRGVTTEVIVCAESQTTIKTTPASNYSVSTTTTPVVIPSNSPCKPKKNPAAYITVGTCVSQQPIQQDSCSGFCPSYEEIDPETGDTADKECLCCAPDVTYTELIDMNCRNATTGQNEQQKSTIVRIQTCKCSMCLGGRAKKLSYQDVDNTNPSKKKTKTRPR